MSVINPGLVSRYLSATPRFGLAQVFRSALALRQLTAQVYQGRWSDVGTPERLRLLNEIDSERPGAAAQ